MGLIFNGNGDVIKAVDGSLTVEGLDIGGSTNIEAGIGTFSGNLNVGGVLTYEDVKNVDSVGIVTARQGVNVTGGGIHVTSGVVTATSFVGSGAALTGIASTEFVHTQTLAVVGVSTFTGNVSMGSSLMMGDDDTIWFGDGADGYIKSDGSNFSIRGYSGATYLRGSQVKISANGGSGGFWERIRVTSNEVELFYGTDQLRLKQLQVDCS